MRGFGNSSTSAVTVDHPQVGATPLPAPAAPTVATDLVVQQDSASLDVLAAAAALVPSADEQSSTGVSLQSENAALSQDYFVIQSKSKAKRKTPVEKTKTSGATRVIVAGKEPPFKRSYKTYRRPAPIIEDSSSSSSSSEGGESWKTSL